MKDLLQSLQDYPPAMLRAIAEARGVSLHTNVARQIVEQLTGDLLDPDNLLAALAGCSTQAGAGLDSLLRTGGRSPAAAFERQYGTIRRFGPGRLAEEAPQRAPANPAEELWYRGLVFRAFAQTPDGLTEFLYVPPDLLALLPTPELMTNDLQLAAAAPPEHVTAAGDELLHDLCTLLALVQAGSVRLAASGDRLNWRAGSRADWNKLLGRPAGKEPDLAAELALTLAAELDLLRADRYRLLLNGRAVREWLELGRGRQRRSLLKTWQRSQQWNDLCRTPVLRCEETGSWRNDPAGTRARLLPLLASLPAGQWFSLDALVAAVKQQQPDFQRPDGDYDTWYLQQRDQQAFLRGFEHWDDVEGQMLRFVLSGPLHWLGASDLGQQGAAAPSGPAALFRFSQAGRAWLAAEPAPVEPEEGRLRVEKDFSISLPADLPLQERFRVARFTTWEPGGPPFRYRITQTGLRRAAVQGIGADRILSYLQEQTGDQLPANVARALSRWQADKD